MMPYLKNKMQRTARSISKFDGLNMNLAKADNELSDDCNMSSDNYPCLSVRAPRSDCDNLGMTVRAMGVKDGIFCVGSTDDDADKTIIKFGENTAEISSGNPGAERQCACLSDQVLIMPDKAVYKPSDNSVYRVAYSKTITLAGAEETAKKQLGASYTTNFPTYIGEITSKGLVSASYTDKYVAYLMPFEEIKAGDVVHISMDVLPSPYNKTNYWSYIDAMNEGFDLKIESVTYTNHDIKGSTLNEITAINFGENAIDMGGFTEVIIKSITLSRRLPDLDDMCSLNNRIWGVKGNTISCCKLGDATQWYDFSADSYGTLPSSCFSADVDTGGKFTAVTSFGGGIIAFKEECIHKIYGNAPDNYTLSTLECNGVKDGARDTLCRVGGALYYMGRGGVYMYDGTRPRLISQKTDLDIADAKWAGTDGKKYYLLAGALSGRRIYVYDPERKSWHMEDMPENADRFVCYDGRLYLLCGSVLKCISGDKTAQESVTWSFTLHFDEDSYATKNYDKLFIKYKLGEDAAFTVETVCDGDRQNCGIYSDASGGDVEYATAVLPIRRCIEFELLFSGAGEFSLIDVTREFFVTSAKRVVNS